MDTLDAILGTIGCITGICSMVFAGLIYIETAKNTPEGKHKK